MNVSGLERRPSAVHRALAAVLQHVNSWSAVWFGLIFWGSVLFATAQRFWPGGSDALQLAVSLSVGTIAGLLARRRGYWL